MRLDWWTLALQTVNFAVLVFLLQRFLYRPVLRIIDARRAEIVRQQESVKTARADTQARVAEIAGERAAIAAERDAVLKAAAEQAEQAVQARRAEAERDAKVLLDGVRRQLDEERKIVLAETRHLALDLATDWAGRLIAEMPERLRLDAWIDRIEQHLKGLSKAELEALVRHSADGHLTVVTAAALPSDAAEAWRSRLRQLLGDSLSVAFESKPDLIAGAELQFPTAILRFSWQSALAAMRADLDHADAR